MKKNIHPHSVNKIINTFSLIIIDELPSYIKYIRKMYPPFIGMPKFIWSYPVFKPKTKITTNIITDIWNIEEITHAKHQEFRKKPFPPDNLYLARLQPDKTNNTIETLDEVLLSYNFQTSNNISKQAIKEKTLV